MEKSTYLVLILLLSVLAFHGGRRQARGLLAEGRRLHSLPSYYGYYTALGCAAPALLLMALWASFEGAVITHGALAMLPAEMTAVSPEQLSLRVVDIQNLARDVVVGEPDPHKR